MPTKVAHDTSVLVEAVKDGATLGIGGFGLDRKPMALVAAIARSNVQSLTLETYAGGFDVEVLVAAGKVARVAAPHVGLDQFGLAPVFRAAREAGVVAFQEWSELSQLQAWRAAADGVPFAPVAMDARSDLLSVNPALRQVPDPFGGPPVVLARAPLIDVAILHAEAAHPTGWAVTSADPCLDPLLARAARTVILSVERLMDDAELERRQREVHLLADWIDAIVLAPGGARPGSCQPLHLVDFPVCRAYVEASGGKTFDAAALAADLMARSASAARRAPGT